MKKEYLLAIVLFLAGLLLWMLLNNIFANRVTYFDPGAEPREPFICAAYDSMLSGIAQCGEDFPCEWIPAFDENNDQLYEQCIEGYNNCAEGFCNAANSALQCCINNPSASECGYIQQVKNWCDSNSITTNNGGDNNEEGDEEVPCNPEALQAQLNAWSDECEDLRRSIKRFGPDHIPGGGGPWGTDGGVLGGGCSGTLGGCLENCLSEVEEIQENLAECLTAINEQNTGAQQI